MKTAAEYAKQFENLSCQGIPKWLIPGLIAFQIETLEEAAKRVCRYCHNGLELIRPGVHLKWHDAENRPVTVLCDCEALLVFIAELKKQGGETEKPMEARICSDCGDAFNYNEAGRGLNPDSDVCRPCSIARDDARKGCRDIVGHNAGPRNFRRGAGN